MNKVVRFLNAVASSHPGGSPQEEENPAKNNDHQDDQDQDHIT